MIFHASLPAQDPEAAATVLAELLGGRWFDFHAFRRSKIVLAGDAHGTALEVYPHTSELVAGETMVEARPSQRETNHSACHIAMSTPRDEPEIHRICAEAGWLSRRCDRGPFQLIEVWIEGNFLVELFPPDCQNAYLASMTIGNWERWQ